MPTSSKPILCYVTERRMLAPAAGVDPVERLLEIIRRCVAAGVDRVQIREKDLPARALRDLTARVVEMSRGTRARILVNDRLDVAIAAEAHGVHLGEASVPAEEVVRWRNAARRREFLVGVSCHSPEAVRAAEAAGADYAFFGPVYATPSKAAFGPPQGVEKLAQVCAAARMPVLAIGGITLENARACFQAGAAGVAAIRMFQVATHLEAAIERLRRICAG